MKACRDELLELLGTWGEYVFAFSFDMIDLVCLILSFVHDEAHGVHVAVHGLITALAFISVAFAAAFLVENKT